MYCHTPTTDNIAQNFYVKAYIFPRRALSWCLRTLHRIARFGRTGSVASGLWNGRSVKQIRSFVLLTALIGMLSVIPPAVAAENYTVDTAHTYILFRVKHLNIGYTYGRLNGATGSFVWDDASPANSRIDMQVMAKGVDTDDAKRDKHLQSPDFFDVGRHPLITFKSTSVKKLEGNRYEITGDMTLLGKTRPITLQVRQTGSGKDPWGDYRRGFETNFTIKRSEFGMDFLLDVVGDEVDLTVSAEGIRQQ